jgi:hypothetical protein
MKVNESRRGSLVRPADDGDEPASVQGSQVEASDGFTQSGREAWRDLRDEFDHSLLTERRRQHRRKQDDLNRHDVDEIRRAVLRSMSDTVVAAGSMDTPAEPDTTPGGGAGRKAVGKALVAVGSVGVASMHSYLHGGWQIGLFILLVVAGLVGVVLAYRGGGNDPPTP